MATPLTVGASAACATAWAVGPLTEPAVRLDSSKSPENLEMARFGLLLGDASGWSPTADEEGGELAGDEFAGNKCFTLPDAT